MGIVGRIASKGRRLWRLVRQGELGPAAAEAGRYLWSTTEEYGLRRDLSLPVEVEPARIEIAVRPLEPRDLPHLFDPAVGDSASQLWRQTRMLDAEIPTCWVAVDRDDIPCFMAWLIRPQHNHLMQEEFRTFLPLARDEVLLDSGFTPQRFRGLRIGPEALTRIALSAYPEARWAWAFTGFDNHRALTSLGRSGFVPTSIVRSKWRLLRHDVEVEPVQPGFAPTTHRGRQRS